MQRKLGRNTIVLLGVGHTNAHVLRMWRMSPIRDAQLVCVSDYPIATYSGMMPGVLAGQYRVREMEIDLVRLCNSAGARLLIGKTAGLDREQKQLVFADRPSLNFDLLSIGIGSRTDFGDVRIAPEASVLAIKPMQTFLNRLQAELENPRLADQPRIAVVGGGVGSIEVAFCLQHRLASDPEWKKTLAGRTPRVTLLTGPRRIAQELLVATSRRLEDYLERQQIEVLTGHRVKRVERGFLETTGGDRVEADIVIWATGAVAHPLLAGMNLETDRRGFVLTRPTLQSLSDDSVFAVGDAGSLTPQATPKAGVYAVRQGPFLWRNIRRYLENKPLMEYRPQPGFLKLINTGDDNAIGEYLGRSFEGAWCWRLKNRIDRKFMSMYQQYELAPMVAEAPDEDSDLRCLGCGGKIGGQLLSQVLSELDVLQSPNVVIGLNQPDDAAVIRTRNNQVTVTTDFFAAPFDDPYLVGRIATLNSASDCFVMGARPTAALAMVQLPLGHPRAQLQVMRELMTGSVEELNRMGASLVGGHSIEGPRTTIGFTVLGEQVAEPATKGRLQEGDCLVLTKPIGTGILLAALMESRLCGWHFEGLLDSMLQSNEVALQLIQQFPVTAITDVTGFGLAGHLSEMLLASRLSATINLERIPLLDGVAEQVRAGVKSTLYESNLAMNARTDIPECPEVDFENHYQSLFDPQTGGGLLFGIGQEHVDRVLRFLGDEGLPRATVVGTITALADSPAISFGK